MGKKVTVTAAFTNPGLKIESAFLVVLSKKREKHGAVKIHPGHPHPKEMERQGDKKTFTVTTHELPDPESKDHVVILRVEGRDAAHNRIAAVGLPGHKHKE